MTQQVLDLGRDVERDVRKLRMELATEGQRVARAVEEVGIAERDVARAARDELANVRHHDVARHDEEPAVVHGRDRAVATPMLAPAAALHVAREPAPTLALPMRVLL